MGTKPGFQHWLGPETLTGPCAGLYPSLGLLPHLPHRPRARGSGRSMAGIRFPILHWTPPALTPSELCKPAAPRRPGPTPPFFPQSGPPGASRRTPKARPPSRGPPLPGRRPAPFPPQSCPSGLSGAVRASALDRMETPPPGPGVTTRGARVRCAAGPRASRLGSGNGGRQGSRFLWRAAAREGTGRRLEPWRPAILQIKVNGRNRETGVQRGGWAGAC